MQYECNLILPFLQSSEVQIEAGKSFKSIGRAEEVSLQFRARDSLSEGIADMSGSGIQWLIDSLVYSLVYSVSKKRTLMCS